MRIAALPPQRQLFIPRCHAGREPDPCRFLAQESHGGTEWERFRDLGVWWSRHFLIERTALIHNNIVVFMIPGLDARTSYLPPGLHSTSWCDVVSHFGGNSDRERLIGALLSACRSLAEAGCKELLLDSSFVTAKALPGDYDTTWEAVGVDRNRWTRCFLI